MGAALVERILGSGAREYSVERLFAFREYSQNASALRVFLVLSLTLSLPFVVLLAIDLVPLQDPSTGWRGNTTFVLRTAVNASVIIGGVLTQARLMVPEVRLTARRMAIIIGGVCTGYVGALILVAEIWTFPIPFAPTLAGIPLCITMPLYAALAFGTRDRTQLWSFLGHTNSISVQATLTLAYPSYNAIFLTLEGPSQLAFVLVLPLMKHAFKLLIARVQALDDDLMPAVLATVDIFDALYMTKCMQSAGSIEVACGIILVDVAQNLIAMLGIVRQSRTLREMYARQKHASSNSGSTSASVLAADSCDSTDNSESPLLGFLVASIKRLRFNSLRLRATRQYVLSSNAQAQIDQLRSSNVVASKDQHRQECPARSTKFSLNSVVPTDPTEPSGSMSPISDEEGKEHQLQILVQESVRLLHECEAVAVIEYIETVVPVFYALYISILFHLPNAKYYEDMRDLTAERLNSVVLNILVYAAMELVSLVWVHRMLQRNFGISIFRQLAFTLENEWRLFQGNFVVWILVVFQFLLVHHGADFSFKFAWIGAHVDGSQSTSKIDGE